MVLGWCIYNYQLQVGKNLSGQWNMGYNAAKSNVLQFLLEDGTKISARPSGTEPKIKFYFSVNTKLANKDAYDETHAMLMSRIKAVIDDMKLK